ncbi:unnamed protein product [Schistosoma turkestanicum]|nr:unnamed protein product [Schistosoma turkestanicum]
MYYSRQCYTLTTKLFSTFNFTRFISHRNSQISYYFPRQLLCISSINQYHNSSLTNSSSLCTTISSSQTDASNSTEMMTMLTSQYLPTEWLQQTFSNLSILNNLKNLLISCEYEWKLGRWPSVKSFRCNEDNDRSIEAESLLDKLFLKVYQKALNIDAKTSIQIIYNVCKYEFSEQSVLVQSNQQFDPVQIRLDILNCNSMLSKLYDPLMNIGVKHVNKLIEHCPELPLSTMMNNCTTTTTTTTTTTIPIHSNQYDTVDSSNTTLLSLLSNKTILQESLEVLSHYLTHNDVLNVVQRFPSVLLRGRTELIDICEFCIHEMSLESYDYVTKLSAPSHRHALRHSTGLCISKCPIWELSLDHVRARYLFLRLIGYWPLVRKTIDKTINVDQQLAQLLKSTPEQFTQWLNHHTNNLSSSKNNHSIDDNPTIPNHILFNKQDIKFYEEIYSHLLIDTNEDEDADDDDDDDDDDHDDIDHVDSHRHRHQKHLKMASIGGGGDDMSKQ